MANAAIGATNLAVDGTVTASSQADWLPATNLLTQHTEERWRSRTNSDFFVLDLGSAKSFDTIILRGMTVGTNATVRVRISLTDSSGAAGDVDDSGTLASGSAYFDYRYGAAYLLASPATGRYIRVDISDADADYVEAGLIFTCLREAFTYNYAPGASLGYVDRSKRVESSGGQTLIWVDNTYRVVDLNFEWVTAEQRYGLIETIDRVNGQHTNLALILDTASTNLARDSIVGLISDLTPVGTPFAAVDLFGKQIRIKERL